MKILPKPFLPSALLGALALVLLCAAPAQSRENVPPPPPPCGMQQGPGVDMLSPMLHAVDLSEAQRDKLFELNHAQMPFVRTKMKVLRNAEGELNSLPWSSDYTDAKAKALVDTIARTRGELLLARIKADRQIHELLTPAQRQLLLDRPQPPRGPLGDGDPMFHMGPAGHQPPRP